MLGSVFGRLQVNNMEETLYGYPVYRNVYRRERRFDGGFQGRPLAKGLFRL